MKIRGNIMLVKVNSIVIVGLEVLGVTIEVNIANRGFPSFDIVGLPTKAIAESKERIKTAIINSGIEFPNKRITVNLAPADLPKEGTMYDFPIAAGIIAASKGINIPNDSVFFGELSLDGSIKSTKGAVLLGLYAREKNLPTVFGPENCVKEMALVKGINVFKISNLTEFVGFMLGEINLPIYTQSNEEQNPDKYDKYPNDMSYILGQSKAKRALEISAAGGHNLLLMGSPGVGKTALVKSLSTILPPLTEQESLEVTKIYSSVGLLSNQTPIVSSRPIRSPHHTISYSGLVGGGMVPKVGELSLAHKGILFLDEFSEFPRNLVESLRQPMEDRKITISRAKTTSTFPCEFTLIAASNPCPCGYLGHPTKPCICSDQLIKKYRSKLSGPIIDRIDLFIEIFAVPIEELENSNITNNNEMSFSIKTRVINARNIQMERNKNVPNSILTNSQINDICTLDKDAKKILNLASNKFNLSPRSYFKIIKVARTIADLAQEKNINENHIAEAIQYKCLQV